MIGRILQTLSDDEGRQSIGLMPVDSTAHLELINTAVTIASAVAYDFAKYTVELSWTVFAFMRVFTTVMSY